MNMAISVDYFLDNVLISIACCLNMAISLEIFPENICISDAYYCLHMIPKTEQIV